MDNSTTVEKELKAVSMEDLNRQVENYLFYGYKIASDVYVRKDGSETVYLCQKITK